MASQSVATGPAPPDSILPWPRGLSYAGDDGSLLRVPLFVAVPSGDGRAQRTIWVFSGGVVFVASMDIENPFNDLLQAWEANQRTYARGYIDGWRLAAAQPQSSQASRPAAPAPSSQAALVYPAQSVRQPDSLTLTARQQQQSGGPRASLTRVDPMDVSSPGAQQPWSTTAQQPRGTAAPPRRISPTQLSGAASAAGAPPQSMAATTRDKRERESAGTQSGYVRGGEGSDRRDPKARRMQSDSEPMSDAESSVEANMDPIFGGHALVPREQRRVPAHGV